MNETEYEQFSNFINETLNETMTLDDYETVLNSLDIPSPKKHKTEWMYKSFCHNYDLTRSNNNLAFYPKTRSYYCWSECNVSHNLLTILEQRFKILEESKSRFQCMKYICNVCDIPFDFKNETQKPKNVGYSWKYLKKYTQDEHEIEEDKIIDDSILNLFPKLYSDTWINDNISIEVMVKYGIRYYQYGCSIVIPCRNIDGKLIGVRVRNLNPNAEHKYYPLRLLNGMQFNFLTNNSLYGLWFTKQAITRHKKVVIGESEKFPLQCETYFGSDNFSCSLYGKAMSEQKKMLLLKLGVTEVIISLDFDYDYNDMYVKDELGNYIIDENGIYMKSKDFQKFYDNIYRIGGYFKSFCKVTALVSYNRHKKKDSSTDNGKEWYMKLYKNRKELY